MSEEEMGVGPKGRALILDPSEEISGQLREVLEGKSFEVVGWNRTGANWFKLYSQYRPHLLFVDLLLPQRDGIYCINKLVAQAPEAKCIFMHTFVGEYANFIEARALKAGASAILQKPIVLKRLETVIERFSSILLD